MQRTIQRLACALTTLIWLGCGDDGGGGGAIDATACPVAIDAGFPDGQPAELACAGTPCGGDVLGVWQVVASCAFGSGTLEVFDCPGGAITFDRFEIDGTFELRDDGTVSAVLAEDAAGTGHIPLDCFGVEQCSQVEALLEAGAFTGATCSQTGCLGEGGACTCAIELVDDVMPEGTWATDGEAITITLGGEVIEGSYCVDGDTLWLGAERFGGVQYRYHLARVTK